MKSLGRAALFLIVMVYPQPSFPMDITMYKELRAVDLKAQYGSPLRVYLKGLADGIEWTQAYLQVEGKARLLCMPDNIALNVENYIQFIDEALAAPRSNPLKPDLPIAMVLIKSLQSKMPCGMRK